MYEVVLYENARGDNPMQEFISELVSSNSKLDQTRLKKLYYTISLLEQGGTRCGEKFTKQITGKLWELRSGKDRVFFFIWRGNHIVLLHTFRKETPKTPVGEIEQAISEMNNWIELHGV
ncbi:type II toxin-antitoxin system RelE/ParE family toxin [Paenibacillus sp. MMO-177]|uniref:type II toxin-antitoxin system RelE/ParE family toxin n=1 Tax=Paenibacillus sp. MMO-177 TaxID=3081289 RepID=UPI0030173848